MSPDKGTGRLDLLAVGVPTWVFTFLVSLVGGWAIGDFLTGDKCDGAAADLLWLWMGHGSPGVRPRHSNDCHGRSRLDRT